MKYNYFLFIPFYGTYLQVDCYAHQIFPLDDSFDADSRKGVTFLAFVDIAAHLLDQIAQNK